MMIRSIFERPLIAALIIGTTIHLFLLMVTYLFMGAGGVMDKYAHILPNPIYLILHLSVPYLIPYLVTSIGKRLTQQKLEEVLHKFPEMNPDIIMRLDQHGNPEYINSAGRHFFKALPGGEEAIIHHLPAKIRETIDVKTSSSEEIRLNEDLVGKDATINFNMRHFGGDSTFITGRDVTEERYLQQRLQHASHLQHSLSAFLDSALQNFTPLDFHLFSHLQQMIASLFLSQGESALARPSHFFITILSPEHQRSGFLFTLSEDGIELHDAEIILNDKQEYAVSSGEDEVLFANYDPNQDELHHFQKRFHPTIRELVGEIEHYATYMSGETAIIAFYQDSDIDKEDAAVLKSMVIAAESLRRISKESKGIEDAFNYTMDALARASEANDEDTGSHIVRINEYSRALAIELGMDKEFVRNIHYSAQMHDVGKIHVSPAILKKPGKLTDQEFRIMQAHPAYGAKILGNAPHLEMAVEIARYHHEKYNGKGYPHGISGEKIPISARIVAISDVYDALRQKRVYKPAFSHTKAIEIITKGDGRTSPEEFDPNVLAAFKRIESQMAKIFDSLQDGDDSKPPS